MKHNKQWVLEKISQKEQQLQTLLSHKDMRHSSNNSKDSENQYYLRMDKMRNNHG